MREAPARGRRARLLAGTCPLRDLARAQADFVGKDFIGKLVITMESGE